MAARPTCPYCGARLSPGARYCDRCGTPLQPAPASTPSRRRMRPERRVAVWVFVLVLLLIFGGGTVGGYRFRAGEWPSLPSAAAGSGAGLPGGRVPTLTTEDPNHIAGYLRSVVAIDAKPNFGSGFLIDDMGHVVTAWHVVEGTQGCMTVIDDDGRQHQATLLNYDKTLDVALLHVADLERYASHLELAAGNPPAALGENAYVVGSPRGVGNTVPLSAKVTGLGADQQDVSGRQYHNLIQVTDATVVNGTSGGPLISKATGQVVGVTLLSGAPAAIAWARPVSDIRDLVSEWAKIKPAATCKFVFATRTIPLTLATITPRSGANGIYGEDLADGADLALRDMQDELRRVGYDVSLRREDDAGSAATARDKAMLVAQDPKVVGVVGSLDSQSTRAVAEALRTGGMPMVAPTAGADDLTAQGWGHFDRIVAPSSRQEQALATFAKDWLKVSSVFLVEDGSVSAGNQVSIFRRGAETISLRIAGTMNVTAASDPAELIKHLAESRAESVYFAGQSDVAFRLVRALRQSGVKLPFLGSQSVFAQTQFQGYSGPGAEGIYFTGLTAEPLDQFRRSFQLVMGKPTRGYAAYGYDSAIVILKALVHYGETHTAQQPTPYELARLVRQTTGYQGWSALISFNEHGENQTASVHVYEWKQGIPEYKAPL